MHIAALIARCPDLDAAELTAWVARGWIAADGTPIVAEIDVARARLIRDLRHDLDVPDDAMPLVLGLLDQVYELRAAVHALSDAVQAQPAPVRDTLHAALAARLRA